jgi:hypothetical protein
MEQKSAKKIWPLSGSHCNRSRTNPYNKQELRRLLNGSDARTRLWKAMVLYRIHAGRTYFVNFFRYHGRGFAACRSMPPINIVNSSAVRLTLTCPELTSGQRKHPRCNRLAQTHRPLPSQ